MEGLAARLGTLGAPGRRALAGAIKLVLRQSYGWSVGMLANQLWSFAGSSTRAEYNNFYFQPFLNGQGRDDLWPQHRGHV